MYGQEHSWPSLKDVSAVSEKFQQSLAVKTEVSSPAH